MCVGRAGREIPGAAWEVSLNSTWIWLRLRTNVRLLTRRYYWVPLNTFQTHLASSSALCRRSLLAAFSRVNLQPCNLWLLRPRQPHWMLSTFPSNCFTSLSSSPPTPPPPAVLAHTGTPAGKTLMYTTPVLFFLVTMDTWSFSALSQLQFGFEPHPKTLPAKFHSPIFYFFFLKWVVHLSQDISQTWIPSLQNVSQTNVIQHRH